MPNYNRPRLQVVLCALSLICTFCPVLGCKEDLRTRVDAKTHRLPQTDWPTGVRDFLEAAGERKSSPKNIEVYYQSDAEYYWTCEYTPEVFDLMKSQWAIEKTNNHKLIKSVTDFMPSDLLKLVDRNAVYYFSSNWIKGDKGNLYCVIITNDNKTIIVRYYFNF